MTVGVKTSPIDRFEQINGTRLHFRESGNTDGIPVLILHGIMGHNREWDVLRNALEDRYHVFGLDQRGHGQSDWAPGTYTLDIMSSDVIELIEALGLAPMILIGHSMGGMISMRTAASRPDLVRSAVIIDIGPESLVGSAEWVADTLRHFSNQSYDDSEEAVREWLAGDPFASQTSMRHYVRHALKERDGSYVWGFDAANLVQFVSGGVSPDQLWDAIDRMNSETLLIRGAFSDVLSADHAREVIRRLDNAELSEIPNGAHDLGVEQQDAVATAVVDFLERSA